MADTAYLLIYEKRVKRSEYDSKREKRRFR